MAKTKKSLAPLTDFSHGLITGPEPYSPSASSISPNLVQKGFVKFYNTLLGDNKKPHKRRGAWDIDTSLSSENPALDRPSKLWAFVRNGVVKVLYAMSGALYSKSGTDAITTIFSGTPFNVSDILQDPITGNAYVFGEGKQAYKYLFGENKGSLTTDASIRSIAVVTPTTGPTLTPDTGTLTGEYRYRYSFVYNTTTETELSTNYSTWSGTNGKINAAVTNPGNGYVTYIRLYRTKDLTGLSSGEKDAAPYYFINQTAMAAPGGANYSFDDEIADAELVDMAQLWGYVTPEARCAVYVNDRIFAIGDYLLYVSDPGKTDSFRAENVIRLPKGGIGYNDNKGYAIAALGDYVFIFMKQGTIYRLVPTQAEEGLPYVLQEMIYDKTYGCSQIAGAKSFNGYIYFIWQKNVYITDGTTISEIPISSKVSNYMQIKEPVQIVTDRRQKLLHFFTWGSTSQISLHLVYDTRFKSWAEWKLANERISCCGAEEPETGAFYLFDYYRTLSKIDIIGTAVYTDRLMLPGTTFSKQTKDVEVHIEKWYNFGKRVFIGALSLYCVNPTGNTFQIITATDNNSIAEAPETADYTQLIAREIGGQKAINKTCERLKVLIVHKARLDLDLDYFELLIPSWQKINMKGSIG